MTMLRLSVLCLGYLLLTQAAQAHEAIHDGERAIDVAAEHVPYAFNAYLSEDLEITAGTVLVFDYVRSNLGGLYVPNSGQFICVDEGLYVFILSVKKPSVADKPGMRCQTKLRRGAEDYKLGPKTSYYSTTWSGVTESMAVMQCTTTPPTAVTAMAMPWSETNPNIVFRTGRTSFSGFRLLPDSPAFTVELSHDQYLFPGGRIMFDHELADFGDNYDPLNGYFRCPDDGIYVFSVSVHTADPDTPWSV